MRTNATSNDDSDDDPERVDVRRVDAPRAEPAPTRLRVRLNLTWRTKIVIAGVVIAGIALFIFMLGLVLILLPWILLFAAVIMALGWLRSFLAGRPE